MLLLLEYDRKLMQQSETSEIQPESTFFPPLLSQTFSLLFETERSTLQTFTIQPTLNQQLENIIHPLSSACLGWGRSGEAA